MRINVRYFGQFRDITGLTEEEIETKDGITVIELRQRTELGIRVDQ